MLSYRHAYHAGNSADVLKHFVIERILHHLVQKDKPCFYLDTHAGAGCYALNSELANKVGEYKTGIALVQAAENPPAVLQPYLNLVEKIGQQNTDALYPGSPWIAANVLREQDRLALCELHPQDYPALQKNFKRDRRVRSYNEDGFSKSIALLPPTERRGLCVIDPSYEVKSDYHTVIEHIQNLHKRFATGTYALWYPVVDGERQRQLEWGFKKAGLKNTLLCELQTKHASQGGMYASGMIVVNAPWTLAKDLNQALPWLSEQLAQDNAARFRVDTIVGE